ncbi:exocyst complex component SEC6, partial [Tanacetum coccineum]
MLHEAVRFFLVEKRHNKDAKVTSIRNLDLQLFKVQLTGYNYFWDADKGRVAAELQELIGTEKNHNKGDVDVYEMMSIPVEAVAAYDSLSDDKELIDTYERLTALDGKRMFALAAVGSHKKEVDRLSVGASALKVAPATATVCCFLLYSDFLSKVGGNQVQKVKVDGVHIMFKLKQDVG